MSLSHRRGQSISKRSESVQHNNVPGASLSHHFSPCDLCVIADHIPGLCPHPDPMMELMGSAAGQRQTSVPLLKSPAHGHRTDGPSVTPALTGQILNGPVIKLC